jgi:hypothetical protein
MIMKTRYSIVMALLLLLAACASPRPHKTIWWPIYTGVVQTPGVTIRAQDGSFVWKSGKVFNTPAFVDNEAWFRKMPTSETYVKSCDQHCKRVRVTVPGRRKALYGIIHLANRSEHSTGPATRSYQIQVPDRYVREASGGRVSVVYEYAKNSTTGRQTTWVLWLSDMPMSCPQCS